MATVFIRKVGEQSGGKMTKVDTLDQLKKVARTKLNINMADESQEDENLDIKIFNKDGGEVEDEDLVLLKDGDIIYAGVCWHEAMPQSSKSWFKHNTSKFLDYHRKQSNERQRFNKRKKSDMDSDSENDFTESERPSKGRKHLHIHRLEEFNINVGVLKLNTKLGKFVQVRKKDGGGINQIHVRRSDDYDSLSRKITEFFQRNSPNLVSPSQNLVIVDLSHEKLCNRVSGKFRVQSYLQYLGKADRPSKVTVYAVGANDYENFSCQRMEENEKDEYCDSILAVEQISNADGLIGSSSSRQVLFEEIQRDVQISESIDRAKEEKKVEEEKAADRQKKEAESKAKLESELKEKRGRRLLPEPEIDENHILINVRHLTRGIITRAFRPDCKVSSVYDWIGSLDDSPLYFALLSPTSQILQDECVKDIGKRYTLCMSERDYAIVPDEVEDPLSSMSTTPNQEEILFNADFLPDQLLSNDPELSPSSRETHQHLDCLQRKRERLVERLQAGGIVLIDKSNIVTEVMSLYRNEDIVDQSLSVSFDEDQATGDGLIKEMFSLFWDAFLASNGEGSSHFTFSLQPGMALEEYVILGRIISHQFLLCGTIPVQVAQSCMEYILKGSERKECVLQSFLSTLTVQEQKTLDNAMNGVCFHVEDIVDILANFNVKAYPTPSNISKIVHSVSEMEIVNKPIAVLTKIRDGVSKFWEDVTVDEIDALYSMCEPTPENIVKSMFFPERDVRDQQITRWLVRYVKSLDKETSSKFLRFCTSSDVIVPGKNIKVELQNCPETAMRPRAKTCFNIIILPKNYATYNQMKNNLNFFIKDPQLWDLND